MKTYYTPSKQSILLSLAVALLIAALSACLSATPRPTSTPVPTLTPDPTKGQAKGVVVAGDFDYQSIRDKGVRLVLVLMRNDPQGRLALGGPCIEPDESGEFWFSAVSPGSYALGVAQVDPNLTHFQNCFQARPLGMEYLDVEAGQIISLGEVNVGVQ